MCDHRGISIFSIAGKIVARLKRILNHVVDKIYLKSLCGFSALRGTINVTFFLHQVLGKLARKTSCTWFLLNLPRYLIPWTTLLFGRYRTSLVCHITSSMLSYPFTRVLEHRLCEMGTLQNSSACQMLLNKDVLWYLFFCSLLLCYVDICICRCWYWSKISVPHNRWNTINASKQKHFFVGQSPGICFLQMMHHWLLPPSRKLKHLLICFLLHVKPLG